MTIKELQDKNLAKGKFHSATWLSTKTINEVEYKKVSKGVVVIGKYGNIKVVKAKQSPQASTIENKKQWIIEDLLYRNENTGNYLVNFITTRVKPKSKYYANGVEISKEDYEQVIKPNTNGKSIMFSVKLENLIDIK